MRLSTDGNQEYRVDLLRRVMEHTDENTKAGAIDYALEFTDHHLRALEQAKDHPDMTPELAEVLSTHLATVELKRTAEVRINE